MDVGMSTVEYYFEDYPVRTAELEFDVQTTKLSVIRRALILASAPHDSVYPQDWEFKVDGILITPIDAVNRFGKLGMVISLRRKSKALSVVKLVKSSKRERIEEEDRVVVEKIRRSKEGIPYTTSNHLVRVMREANVVFQRELNSNGVIHNWIFMIMGHISAKITRVALPVKSNRLVFKTVEHGFNNNMDFILKSKQDETTNTDAIVVCPYISPYHVAVMCYDKTRGRLLHFDSSSTLIPINEAFFRVKDQFKYVSYTFIDYQLYDEPGTVRNLAGGNCGMFSGLNAIQCVLQYDQEFVSFNEFWQRFLRVLQRTPEEKKPRIVLHLTKRLSYSAFRYEEKDFGRSSVHYDSIPFHLINEFPEALERVAPDWFKTCDFTCDYIMLGYFLDANLGFHQASKLGNAFRLMLQDIVTRGFESLTFNIAEAMKRLCSVCETIEASFVCPCSEARYCGAECQHTHWEEHKKTHSLYCLFPALCTHLKH